MRKNNRIPANYMDIAYVRNPDFSWDVGEDGIVVVDVPNTGFFNRVAQTFFHRPRISHISLDKYGSTVWNLVNGENTVFDIVKHMENVFPDEKEKMVDRVVKFMRILDVNHYILIKK